MPAELGVGVQVPAQLDCGLADFLDPGKDIRDQQVMTHARDCDTRPESFTLRYGAGRSVIVPQELRKCDESAGHFPVSRSSWRSN
ncbi:hypothetical protein GCM10009745_50890 [Kribbella yunnanensis]|uniref:Uncharacterized protein n=1 Tax=Kribbella yunnanensis TaxID=190194 RepID=A0ABP4U4G2_9ACTN